MDIGGTTRPELEEGLYLQETAHNTPYIATPRQNAPNILNTPDVPNAPNELNA